MHFFLPGPAPDDEYRNVRDQDDPRGFRDFVEELWTKYQHLADQHFRQDARSHFHERFWEMYLAVALIRRGYEVQSTSGTGPDLCVIDEGTSVYVEATAPGPGESADAVPEPPPMVASTVPEKQILFRLRGTIEAKLAQFKQWVAEGVVNESRPYIIAVNGRRIQVFRREGNLPSIVKAVLPFGDYSVVWDTSTDEITNGFYSHRDTIRKASGSDVRTDVFDSDAYREVSAVLYAWCDYANHAVNLGDEFILVHNPKARNPIRHGLFPFGHEYEYSSDEESLRRKDWNAGKSA